MVRRSSVGGGGRGAALGVLFLVAAPVIARADAPSAATVVLDAGHGGSNVGASARAPGVFEKRVTLQVARAVKRRLESDGLRVVLTRDRDEYLTLGERVRRANAASADVFLSLHANSSPDHARRGVETYVVSREIADVAAARAGVAADPVAGMEARARMRWSASQSFRLATYVHARLVAVRKGDRGVRQAPYDVLDGVTCPAALVEIGYLDHPEEGDDLLREEVVTTIADAIASGVLDYLTHRARP